MGEVAVTAFFAKLESYLKEPDDMWGSCRPERNQLISLKDRLSAFLPLFFDRLYAYDDPYEEIRTRLRMLMYDIEDAVDSMIIYVLKNKHQRLSSFLLCGHPRLLNKYTSDLLKYQYQVPSETTNTEGVGHHPNVLRYIPGVSMLLSEVATGGDNAFRLDDHLSYLDKAVFEDKKGQELLVTTVFGVGGVGKTFLVDKFFKTERVTRFFDYRVWVSASNLYSAKGLLRSILNELCHRAVPYALDEMNERSLWVTTHRYLRGKKFLLVLDDAWSENMFRIFSFALPRFFESGAAGRLIITTRSDLFTKDYIYGIPNSILHLDPLKEEDAWRLFCIKLSGGKPSDDTAMLISSKPLIERLAKGTLRLCEGLPLLITLSASAISRTDQTVHAWTRIYESIVINSSFSRIYPIVEYSYRCLPPKLKYVFLYCSLFHSYHEIEMKTLISLCVADRCIFEANGSENNNGDNPTTIKDIAVTYIMDLICRSMLQPVRIGLLGTVESIQVHDAVQHIATEIIKRGDLREFYTNLMPRHVRRLLFTGSTSRTAVTDKAPIDGAVRSCFVRDAQRLPSSLVHHLNSGGLPLLHALDVRGVKITSPLLNRLGDLVLLRHLVLRCASIKKLPSSLSRLHFLQTFDIRDTQVSQSITSTCFCPLFLIAFSLIYFSITCIIYLVRHLPGGMVKLENLRSIHLSTSFARNVVEWPLPLSHNRRFQLETFAGVKATTRLVEELQYLTELRKLSIGRVTSNDSDKLCASVNRMKFLGSLTIKCDEFQTLQMQILPNSMEGLHTLRIGGRIDQLAHVVRCFPLLSRLYLWDNHLKKEEPLSILQNLPNLVILCLTNTYLGKEMRCGSQGFPKLKSLSVLCMRNLEAFTVERGGMPNLKNLVIGHCENLKAEQFECIEHLPALQLVKIPNMKEEFTDRVSKVKNDSCKVHETPLFVYGQP